MTCECTKIKWFTQFCPLKHQTLVFFLQTSRQIPNYPQKTKAFCLLSLKKQLYNTYREKYVHKNFFGLYFQAYNGIFIGMWILGQVSIEAKRNWYQTSFFSVHLFLQLTEFKKYKFWKPKVLLCILIVLSWPLIELLSYWES